MRFPPRLRPALLRVAVLLLVLSMLTVDPLHASAPRRAIVVGGALTEIVYALGAQDSVVAVDATSTYPPAADALPDVGYMRRLAAEPLLSLAPDLILAIEGAGPPAVLDQVRAAGVRVLDVPDQPSVAGVHDKVRRVAQALGRSDEGEALIQSLDARLAALRPVEGAAPRVLFLMSVGEGAPLAAGRDTPAEAVIRLAGGVNALDGFTGFKPLSPEAAAAARPDVVLVPTRTLAGLGGAEAILARPELAGSPAAQAKRLVAMDTMLLLGFGPRLPEAVAELAAGLHAKGP
ncbi:heme/hemin ABC transporter substrate-binding protein [Pararhodospirillum photometricum]|nr:ABC transporter substrate-binding protein [Pararhodospirillum photometricum]